MFLEISLLKTIVLDTTCFPTGEKSMEMVPFDHQKAKNNGTGIDFLN